MTAPKPRSSVCSRAWTQRRRRVTPACCRPPPGAHRTDVGGEQTEALPNGLGTPAMLAVLLLSVVSAGLVRASLLTRRISKPGAHSAG